MRLPLPIRFSRHRLDFFIEEIFSLKRDTLSLVYDGLIPVAKATTGYPRRQNITAWIEAIGYRGVEKRLVVRAEPGLTFLKNVLAYC